jgi:hypothetical protein
MLVLHSTSENHTFCREGNLGPGILVGQQGHVRKEGAKDNGSAAMRPCEYPYTRSLNERLIAALQNSRT